MHNKIKRKKKSFKKIYLVMIVIASLLMGFGYASVNSVLLDIGGNATALNQDSIYITEVNYLESKNADLDKSKITDTHQTLMSSSVVLSDNDSNSYITYSVTIYNSTGISFSFIDTNYDEAFYDNDNIVFTLDNIKKDDVIESKGYLTFNITFKYKSGVTPSNKNNTLNSYLNFLFLHPVNYIESTGSQFIDTGVKPNTDSTFDMEFALTDVDRIQSVYGTRTSMDNGIYHNIFVYKNKLRWDENGTQIFPQDLYYSEGKKIHFQKTDKQIIISTNGTSLGFDNPSIDWKLDGTVYVFNQNQQSEPETRTAYMRLYYLKMYDNGTLVRDFVPVLDKNAVPCLYDLVTNKYFYNIGTGRFDYSETFEVLEYLESSGTQYIDTLIKPNTDSKAEFVMSLNEVYAGTQSIFGSRIDQVNNTFNMFWYHSLRWDFNDTITFPTYSTDVTKAFYVRGDAEIVQVNDEITNHVNKGTFNSPQNVYIFSINNGGNSIYPNEGMKLYYFKLYDKDTVVANFIPVKDTKGVACLYDLISHKYFYNKGTGNFIGK